MKDKRGVKSCGQGVLLTDHLVLIQLGCENQARSEPNVNKWFSKSNG